MSNKCDGNPKPRFSELGNFFMTHKAPKIVGIASLVMALVFYLKTESSQVLPYSYTVRQSKELCPNMIRAGVDGDGGWWTCGKESTSPSQEGSCVVYSFGIRDNFSFDQYIADRGCQVHGFDPSPHGLDSKKAYEEIPHASYHSFGLGYVDKKYGENKVPFRWPGLGYLGEGNTAPWQLFRLPSIMSKLGNSRVTILKIDVEGAEWDAIEDIALADWDELYMELHFPPSEYQVIPSEMSSGDLTIARTPDRQGVQSLPARNVPGPIDRIAMLKLLNSVADMFYWESNKTCQEAFQAECIETYFKRKKGKAGYFRGRRLPEPQSPGHLVE